MNTQKGFAHGFLVVGLVAFIIGSLSVVFWKKFIETDSIKSSPSSALDESVKKPKEVKFKEHTSITGSGLTFTYPDSWTFLPADKVNDFSGRFKTAHSMLFSQPPSPIRDKIEIPSDHVCVTFTEIAGDASFSHPSADKQVADTEFTVGESTVAIFESEVSQESYSGHLMSINPASDHGASYIALNNNYFLLATSQKNCYPNDSPMQRNVSQEVEQSKAILKSVNLRN